MTTDENLLKEMLDRATNSTKDTVDELCVQMFCMVVRSDVQLIEKALELILTKIRAVNVTEAIRAIALLEECMSSCGADFQNEVAKFRFLNDLIRVVSVKYDGGKTPVAIKQRITDCLLLWTTEFPQKTKIREVYDMLSKEECMQQATQTSSVPISEATKRESTLGIDEKLFADLVHSNDPQNLKKANLLILKGVSQDARRTELVQQFKSELEEVRTIVLLLNQMLDSYETEGNTATEDNLNLIRELYLSCKRHRTIITRMPALMDTNVNDALLGESLAVGDSLQFVMKRYKQTIVHPPMNGACIVSNEIAAKTENTDLLKDLLSDLPTNNALSTSAAVPITVSAKANPLDELTEIFGNDSVADQPATDTTSVELLGSFDLLNDAAAFPEPKNVVAPVQTPPNAVQPVNEKRPFRDLPEIDKLSAELFEMSLPSVERINSFKKDPEKLTLNDLAKERKLGVDVKTPPSNTVATSLSDAAHPNKSTLEYLTTTTKVSSSANKDEDDKMLNSAQEVNTTEPIAEVMSVNSKQRSNELPLKHLSEIEISLDDVEPTSEERLLLDDDDIKIMLNFTEDRPSRHVSVLVLTVLNKCKMAIKDFQFEASVRKPSKVRLLPPTASHIPPFKAFRPPTPINQVMLLLNPTGKAIDVTCIVGYKSGDDPDPIKESLVAKDIPYVD